VLAIVASRIDPGAGALVDAWSSAGAALLSAEDLSIEGWAFRVSDPGGGTAVVDGRRVPVRELQAVVTRRPAVVAEELVWIDPVDRSYMAAEANAFLVAWLHQIPCLVVNRPTATSLCGPAWTPVHWAAAAAGANVAWAPQDRDDSHEVVVVGDRCVGARSPAEGSAACALAHAAGAELLGVRFAKDGACAATPMPPIDDDVRGLLLAHVQGRAP
jgi:hypothetical protein